MGTEADQLHRRDHAGAAVLLRPRWNGHITTLAIFSTSSAGRSTAETSMEWAQLRPGYGRHPRRPAAVLLRPRWNGHDEDLGAMRTGLGGRSTAETSMEWARRIMTVHAKHAEHSRSTAETSMEWALRWAWWNDSRWNGRSTAETPNNLEKMSHCRNL